MTINNYFNETRKPEGENFYYNSGTAIIETLINALIETNNVVNKDKILEIIECPESLNNFKNILTTHHPESNATIGFLTLEKLYITKSNFNFDIFISIAKPFIDSLEPKYT